MLEEVVNKESGVIFPTGAVFLHAARDGDQLIRVVSG